MTVSSDTTRTEYVGSGNTGPFSIGFDIQSESHLTVTRRVIATGVETELTLNAGSNGYTVNAALTQITTTEAVGNGTERLVIVRNVPLTQGIDYLANTAFPSESTETGLDKITMIVQQLSESLDRTIKLPVSSTYTGITIPDPEDGKLIIWDGDNLANGPTADNIAAAQTNATAAASSAAAAASSAAAAAASAALGTFAAFTPTGSSVPTNGIYLPSSTTVGIAANSKPVAYFQGTANTNVNYWQFNNAATGGASGLTAVGTDTNVAGVISSQGTGSIFIQTNTRTVTQFEVSHTASAVNRLAVTGSATGNDVTGTLTGSDTNISGRFIAKGTGAWTLNADGGVLFKSANNSNTDFAVTHTASSVNYIAATGAATSGVPVFQATGSDTNIGIDIKSKASAAVRIFTGGTQRASVESNGVSLFGKTSAGIGNSGVELALGSVQNPLKVTTGASAGSGTCLDVNRSVGTGTYIDWYYLGSVIASVSTNGTTVTYGTSSDRRLKKDFAPVLNSGDIIDSLQIYSFGWKTNSELPRSVGVIAQEAYDIFPDAVIPGDENEAISFGQEGFRPWNVDYAKFVPVLIAEIKALRTRIGALEA